MSHRENHKTERIEIRTTPEIKQLLKKAAEVNHLNITDFLIQHALSAATQALTDRKAFLLNEEAWSSFMMALDRPTQHKPALETLLSKPSVFE